MDFKRSYTVSSRKCIEYNNLRITYKIKVFRKKTTTGVLTMMYKSLKLKKERNQYVSERKIVINNFEEKKTTKIKLDNIGYKY